MKKGKVLRRSELGSLAPIGAASFSRSIAQQKDIAESGTAFIASLSARLQKELFLNCQILYTRQFSFGKMLWVKSQPK